MPAPKGFMPVKAGQGRPKGSQNKLSADVKEMIIQAMTIVGGGEYLARQAEANPVAFMSLLSKMVPLTLHGDAKNPLLTGIQVSFVSPGRVP